LVVILNVLIILKSSREALASCVRSVGVSPTIALLVGNQPILTQEAGASLEQDLFLNRTNQHT